MKVTKLRIRKKVRIVGIKRLKKNIDEIVHNCLIDIKPYIVKDIMIMLKKQGIIYEKKQKKDSKTKKK